MKFKSSSFASRSPARILARYVAKAEIRALMSSYTAIWSEELLNAIALLLPNLFKAKINLVLAGDNSPRKIIFTITPGLIFVLTKKNPYDCMLCTTSLGGDFR